MGLFAPFTRAVPWVTVSMIGSCQRECVVVRSEASACRSANTSQASIYRTTLDRRVQGRTSRFA